MNRAAKLVKEPDVEKTERADEAKSAVADAAVALRVIPLKIGALVSPYRKHGRLSLRIERMPQLARLSAGRNNGDNSWSLGSDELDDLTYMVPESLAEHTLAIRVFRVDGNAGNTIAVLEYLVSPDATAPSPAREGAASSRSAAIPADDGLLQRLRDELTLVKATLGARDAELAKAQQRAELAELDLSRRKADAEIAVAQADWKAELDERLTAAVSQSAADLQQQREAWEAEQSARTAKLEERALERLLEARERWQKESDDRLQKAELAWQNKSAKALAEARVEAGRGQASETELRGLHEKLASLKSKLADRDAALAEARAEMDQERARWQHQADAALVKAELAWTAKDAARLSAAEAQWKEQLAAAQAEAGRGQTSETELRRLHEQLAALRTTLADRDAALAQARAEIDEERARAQRQADATLLKAQQAWKAKEAQWQDKLADAQAEAGREQTSEAEFHRLREKLGALKANLAERDAALAQARAEIDEEPERRQREIDAALAKAKKTWKADEAARLAAAEAQWQEKFARAQAEPAREQAGETELRRLRKTLTELEAALANARSEAQDARAAAEAQWRRQSESALAEAVQRYEAAEEALAQLRLEAEAAQYNAAAHADNAWTDDSATIEEAPPAPAPRIVLRRDADWVKEEQAKEKPKPDQTRRLVRDAVLAAALAAAAIFVYPVLEPYLPPGMRLSHPAMAIASGPIAEAAPAETAPPAAAPAPAPPVAPQPMAVALQDANVRADPSTTAAIVSRLKRGKAAALVERRGDWTLLRLDGERGSAPLQGWVHRSLLSDDGTAPEVKSN